jgi:hypothetical protein
MPLQIDPPIEFQPRGMPVVTLSTFEEAEAWSHQERDAWMPWRQINVPPPVAPWRDELWNPLVQMGNAAAQAIQQQTNPSQVTISRNQIGGIVGQYQQGPLIASQSPDGVRLLQKFAAGDHLGAVVEAVCAVNRRSIPVALFHQNQVFPIDAHALITRIADSISWNELTKAYISAGVTSQQAIIEEFSQRLVH